MAVAQLPFRLPAEAGRNQYMWPENSVILPLESARCPPVLIEEYTPEADVGPFVPTPLALTSQEHSPAFGA